MQTNDTTRQDVQLPTAASGVPVTPASVPVPEVPHSDDLAQDLTSLQHAEEQKRDREKQEEVARRRKLATDD